MGFHNHITTEKHNKLDLTRRVRVCAGGASVCTGTESMKYVTRFVRDTVTRFVRDTVCSGDLCINDTQSMHEHQPA